MFYLTNMLCSVVKHAGSGRVRKKCRGKQETQSEIRFTRALEEIFPDS